MHKNLIALFIILLFAAGPAMAKLMHVYPGSRIAAHAQEVRNAAMNMVLNKDIAPRELRFDEPDTPEYHENPQVQVFHSEGGGAQREDKPDPDNSDGTEWVYTKSNELLGLGSSSPEILAIAPDIKPEACNLLSKHAGIEGKPLPQDVLAGMAGQPREYDYVKILNAVPSLEPVGKEIKDLSVRKLDTGGAPAGCFRAPDNRLYYIGLIMEQ